MHVRTALTLLIAVAATAAAPALPAADGHTSGPLDAATPAEHVDPMIGTFGGAWLFPGPVAPFGMVQLSPDTEGYFASNGYQYLDATIRGFSHTHFGGGGGFLGDVPFMPTTGADVDTDHQTYAAPFSHATETAEAGYYAVTLPRYGVDAELTTGLRVGMHRYTFTPGTRNANVVIDAGRWGKRNTSNPLLITHEATPATVEVVDDRTILTTVRTGPGEAAGDSRRSPEYPYFLVARFDRPFERAGTYASRGGAVDWSSTTAASAGAGAVVGFDATTDTEVVVKVGVSFTSAANALANLESELPGEDFDFDAQRRRAWDAWNHELSRVTVSNSDPATLRTFYTALYHALHFPSTFNDASGDYLRHGGTIGTIGAPGDPMPAGSTYYANYSLWDTYRSVTSLQSFLYPDRYRDQMRSLTRMAEDSGKLTRWGAMNDDPEYMFGSAGMQHLSEGVCRGLLDDAPSDLVRAYTVLEREFRDQQRTENSARSFFDRGYVAHDLDDQGAAHTPEWAIGGFAGALVADRLGEVEDREMFLGHAEAWRNQLDDEYGTFRPRLADGTWVSPFDPNQIDGFKQGSAYQWTWLVPHDVDGLFAAIDASQGPGTADARLDEFHAAPADAQGRISVYGLNFYGNQFTPSNQHDLHTPHMHAWRGKPEQVQLNARDVRTAYNPTPEGMSGNDDLGTMSAWYVLSAIGLNPAIYGAPGYVVGSPAFDAIAITPSEGEPITISATGAGAGLPFVSGATLGETTHDSLWLLEADLRAAGSLSLSMSPTPSTWGATRPPPSLSTQPDLTAFGCR